MPKIPPPLSSAGFSGHDLTDPDHTLACHPLTAYPQGFAPPRHEIKLPAASHERRLEYFFHSQNRRPIGSAISFLCIYGNSPRSSHCLTMMYVNAASCLLIPFKAFPIIMMGIQRRYFFLTSISSIILCRLQLSSFSS